MNRSLLLVVSIALLAAGLLLGAGIAAQDDEGEEEVKPAPDDWEPWFDEAHTMRVPITVPDGTPFGGPEDGPRLVAHEVDVTEALREAGWPTDAADRPEGFTLEPDSVRVVPAGEEDPDPVHALAWEGPVISEPGSFPSTHDIATVAFFAEKDVDEYYVYLDRTEDADEHEPLPRDAQTEQRMMQLLAGPGAGHQVTGVMKSGGNGGVQFAIGATSTTSVTAEVLTAEGWSAMSGCSGTIFQGAWTTCTERQGPIVTPVRFQADSPIIVHAWPAGQALDQFIPLASASGGLSGETLFAPHVDSPETDLNLMAAGSPCDVDVDGQHVRVTDDPRRVSITGDSIVDAECEILGWLPGDSISPMPMAPGDPAIGGLTPTSDADKVVVVGVGDADRSATLVNMGSQSTREAFFGFGSPSYEGHVLKGGLFTLPEPQEDTPYRLGATDMEMWPSMWTEDHVDRDGILPLAPTKAGGMAWLGPSETSGTPVTLVTVGFQETPRMGMAISGQPLITEPGSVLQSETARYGSDGLDADVGGLAEVWTQGQAGLTANFAVVGTSEASAPTILSGHIQPLTPEQGQPHVIGPVFDLEMEPRAEVTPPGGVETFEILGEGQIREPTGEIRSVEVRFNAEVTPVQETAPEADFDLENARTHLPIDEAGTVTTLTVASPAEIPPDDPPSYVLSTSATPIEGGDTVGVTGNLQVVPDRELSITFEDGSSFTELDTQDGYAEASLVVQNEGTTTETVELSTSVPGQVDWEVQLVDPHRNEPVEELVGLAPEASRTLELQVEAPGEAARSVPVTSSVRSSEDASVTDEAKALVAHEVDVDLFSQIRPDLLTLERGEQSTVNLSLVNQGSPVNVQIQPEDSEFLVVDTPESSVNLGENGTDLDSATVPLDIVTTQDAPLDTVLVGTVRLEVGVEGLDRDLEMFMSFRAHVVPSHALEAVDTIEVLPGLEQTATLTVRAAGDTDEDLSLNLVQVPRGWDVQAPDRVQVPQGSTAPLEMNVTPPRGLGDGVYEIGMEGVPDDGTDPVPLTARLVVPESPALHLSAPDAVEMGQGETRELAITIENRGNEPADASVDVDANLTDARVQPSTFTLARDEQRTLTLTLEAIEQGNGTLTLTAEPGGLARISENVGLVDLSISLVSIDPPVPEEGEPVQALVEIANHGDALARDVPITLVADGVPVRNETLGRLAPGDAVTMTVGTDRLPTAEALSLQVDPEGVYVQGPGPSDQVSASPDEAPGLTLIATVLSVAIVAYAERRRS